MSGIPFFVKMRMDAFTIFKALQCDDLSSADPRGFFPGTVDKLVPLFQFFACFLSGQPIHRAAGAAISLPMRYRCSPTFQEVNKFKPMLFSPRFSKTEY